MGQMFDSQLERPEGGVLKNLRFWKLKFVTGMDKLRVMMLELENKILHNDLVQSFFFGLEPDLQDLQVRILLTDIRCDLGLWFRLG